MERFGSFVLDELLHGIRTDGPPPIDVVVSLLAELAEALTLAHEQGVVHGDIRPEHLLIDASGHLSLLGFGMAQIRQPMAASCYAAPESIQGAPADARSDLYSLGVVAYELVTGRPLFDEHTNPELRRYLASCISAPSTCNRDCPREMDELLLGALATDPDERWTTAGELLSALARIGGPAPERVSEWLSQTAPHPQPPAIGAMPPLPPRDLPVPPKRVARGTRRLPSPTEIAAPPKLEESPLDPDEPVPEPEESLLELLERDDPDDSIHEAATEIRELTPPHPRSLHLPLQPPEDPYEELAVLAHTTSRSGRNANPVLGVQNDSDANAEVTPLPMFAPSPLLSDEPPLLPLREPRSLPRSLEIGLAFLAGALTMYVLFAWLA